MFYVVVFRFRMKRILTIALLVTASMINFTESKGTPTTLCQYSNCPSDVFGNKEYCILTFALQIRDDYYGEVVSDKCNVPSSCKRNFNNKKCSSDGQFCVQTLIRSDDLVLQYGNVDRVLLSKNGRKADADDWCKSRYGTAYWFEV